VQTALFKDPVRNKQ